MQINQSLINTWKQLGWSNNKIKIFCSENGNTIPPLPGFSNTHTTKSRKYSFRISLKNWELLETRKNKSKFLNEVLSIYSNKK